MMPYHTAHQYCRQALSFDKPILSIVLLAGWLQIEYTRFDVIRYTASHRVGARYRRPPGYISERRPRIPRTQALFREHGHHAAKVAIEVDLPSLFNFELYGAVVYASTSDGPRHQPRAPQTTTISHAPHYGALLFAAELPRRHFRRRVGSFHDYHAALVSGRHECDERPLPRQKLAPPILDRRRRETCRRMR